ETTTTNTIPGSSLRARSSRISSSFILSPAPPPRQRPRAEGANAPGQERREHCGREDPVRLPGHCPPHQFRTLSRREGALHGAADVPATAASVDEHLAVRFTQAHHL